MTDPSDDARLGTPVLGWTARAWPARQVFAGRTVRMEPVAPRHSQDLFAAFALDRAGANWAYLPYGPFETLEAFETWMAETVFGRDPQFYAFVSVATGRAQGLAALMRMVPDHGVIEVGHIHLSPLVQRTAAATEGLYLLMRHAMTDLGYRRFEWKCNALNTASRRSAERLGFTFEGVFRQAHVFKGRNRDTAWFSFLDSEWPRIDAGFQAWLHPDNFDADGRQIRPLERCRRDHA